MSINNISDIRSQYKNFAFISYSHGDLAWGKRIHAQLERYRLPARLRKKYKNIPSRAFPIFRDETDLSGFKVWPSIVKELDDSRYLIVICSPKSAASEWVNDEVLHFIETGKEDRILPLIIDGIPNSGDPETECFPPALREMEQEPLGVDVRKLGWRKAYLKVISALLDVDSDELLRRDTHRRIRNGTILAGMVSMVCVALGCFLWYNAEHSKYYNAYTYQYEIPVGIYELSEQERGGKHACYRITTRRDKVIRLETVNSRGVVINPIDVTPLTEYPIQEFAYNEQGELNAVVLKDAWGREITRKNVEFNKEKGESVIEFQSPSNKLKVQALPGDMSSYLKGSQSTESKSEITRHYNFYNADGYLVKTLYQRNNLEEPACDSNGVYGLIREYNDRGLVSLTGYLNEDGELHNSKEGYAYSEMFYDEKGNFVYGTNHSADGRRVRTNQGVSALRREYDATGNLVIEEILDEKDHLTYHKDGLAKCTVEYNEQGDPIVRRVFDVDGNLSNDCNGVHETRYTYDHYGRCKSTSLFDISGAPVYSSELGYASVQWVLDQNGRTLEERTYDAQGNPCCSRETGAYGYRYAYNEAGHHIRTDYLNAEGELSVSKYGYASWCLQPDGDGRIIKEEYRDERGKFTRNHKNFAMVENTYDTFGNATEIRIYDENGNLCCHKEGHAVIQRTYEGGNLVSERVYDSNRNPTYGKNYYFECRWEYDERGNCIRRSYYDTEGNPIDMNSGYAAITYEYDAYGNVTKECYYMADGKPAYLLDAYEYQTEYDSRGNQIRGVMCSAMPEQRPFLIVEAEYDYLGNCIGRQFYDEKGNPPSADRFATQQKMEYDHQGNLLREEFIYEAEQPYSSIKIMTYDEKANLILEQWFVQNYGEEALCQSQVRYTYDDYGNCIRTEYLDGNGMPRNLEEGYASFAQGFTPEGYVSWMEYYDANSNPCLYDATAFRYEYEYDAAGNCAEMRQYDTAGELLKEENGNIAILRYKYDVHGIKNYTGRFNEHGQPFGTEEIPVSAIEYSVDIAGFQEEMRYYDKNGNLLQDYRVYVHAPDVYEGFSGYEMGVKPGMFVVQVGDWNYYKEYEFSSLHALQAELARTIYTEKELVLCEWTEENTFRFYRFQMPEGAMGIRFMSDLGDAAVLDRMEEAYRSWIGNGGQS